MQIDFDGPYFDPGLIGPDGRLSRLHKSASKPPPPAPTPAPVRVEPEPEAEAARRAGRRKGLADTILAGSFSTPTLGRKTQLGASSMTGGSSYGGES